MSGGETRGVRDVSEGQTSRTWRLSAWAPPAVLKTCACSTTSWMAASGVSATHRCPAQGDSRLGMEGHDLNSPTYQRGFWNHFHCYHRDPCKEELQARFEIVIREKLGFLETHKFLPFPVLAKKTHLWQPVGLKTPFLQQRELSLPTTWPIPGPLQPAALPSAHNPPYLGWSCALSSQCPPSPSLFPHFISPNPPSWISCTIPFTETLSPS